MSIVGIAQERPDSPFVDASLNQRVYTREFRVQTDDLADGPFIVAGALGIPKLYSYYQFGNERDLYARLRNIAAKRLEPGSYWWIVTCRYETPTPEGHNHPDEGGTKHEQDGQADNPLIMLPEIETALEKYQEVVYLVYDVLNGTAEPCQASNGQVFDPPPTKDASRLILTITRNEDINSAHPATGIQYADAVNSDMFWGSAPGCAKCQSITPSRQTKQLSGGTIFPYLKVTYKFEFRPTWDRLILDAGTWFRDPATSNKIAFQTDDGHPRTGLLDGVGHNLQDEKFGSTTFPGAPAPQLPVFKPYRFYPRLSFAALNLPQSFQDVA